MKKNAKQILVVLLTLSIVLQQFSIISTAATPIVDVKVNTSKEVDVFLSVGDVTTTYKNFAEDLEANLVSKGIPTDEINITAYEEAVIEADGNLWWPYDHYNTTLTGIAQDRSNGSYFDSSDINAWLTDYPDPKIDDVNHQYVELDTRTNNFTLKRHIDTTVPGVVTFRGYNSDPNKDFLYYPDDEPYKKTIQFEVNELFAADALYGAGFLFNTKITEESYGTQTMSGYMIYFPYSGQQARGQMKLYKFKDIPTNTFHSTSAFNINYTPTGFTLIDTAETAYNSLSVSSGKQPWRKVVLEVDATSFKMWYAEDEDNQITGDLGDSDLVEWTGSATELTLTAHPGDDLGYGFGPLVEYGSHGCSRPTVFSFLNIAMKAEAARGFLDVIRQPNWNLESDRYVINIDDSIEADFNSRTKLGEILSRMENQDVHYIGWGNDATATQGADVIDLNSDRGLFVNRESDAYSDWIDETADYIYQNYLSSKTSDTSSIGDTVYVPYGKTPEISVTPSNLMSDTIDSTYTDGKWKIVHDETVYENDMGKNDLHNLYTNNVSDIVFDKVGKYELYYENTKVKTIYVHQKPVARFDFSVDGSNNLTINEKAYDPDKDENPSDNNHKGIAETEISYKTTSSSAVTIVTTSAAISIAPDEDYILMLRVKDEEGAWSTAYAKHVHTGSEAVAPIADFSIFPSDFYPYKDTLQIEDHSYDAKGKTIDIQEWKVIKGKEEVSTGSSFAVSMLNDGEGEYKVYQRVTNSDSIVSEWFVNYITLYSTPTPDLNITVGMTNDELVYNCQLSGLPSGNGIIYQYKLGVDGTWTNGSDFSVSETTDVYYRVEDSTGNYSDESMEAIVIEDFIHLSRIPDVEYYNDNYAVRIIQDNSYNTSVYKTIYRIISDTSTSAWLEYSFGNNISISEEGLTAIEAKVVRIDDNEIIADWDSINVNIEKSLQAELEVVYSPNSEYSNNKYIVILNAKDITPGSLESSHVTLQYTINNGTLQNYNSPFELTEEGEYTINAKLVDRYGNEDTESITIEIDKNAPSDPTIEFSDNYVEDSWTYNAIDFEISGSTDVNSITYLYSLDNGLTWIESSTGTISNEGITTIKYKAIDSTSLESSELSAIVKIDNNSKEVEDGQEYGMILKLLGTDPVQVTVGDLYYEPGYEAKDVDGSDITESVSLSGMINTNEVGTYTITYTVVGERTVINSRVVQVIEKALPASTVITTTEEEVDDTEMEEAVDAAKDDDSGSVKIVVPKDVEVDQDVKVSIKKQEIKDGKENELTLIVEANNVKVELPMKDIPVENMPKYSRLRIAYENIDDDDEDNDDMLEKVNVIDPNIGIFDGMIFDVSMFIVEEDANGNELGTEKVEHFQSDEDIVIELFVGTGMETKAFLTFYYNEEEEVWEFIRSEYQDDGFISLNTKHLSIYSVMEMTSAEKRDSLAALLHSPMTLEEVRNILEDVDVTELPDGLTSASQGIYEGFENSNKDKVAQKLLDAADETPFENFEDLKNAFTLAVNEVNNEINSDTTAPIIVLKGNNPTKVYYQEDYIEPGALATDDVNGDISGSIIVHGSVDTSTIGEYTLTYSVVDSNNNEAEVTRLVKVISKPNITLEGEPEITVKVGYLRMLTELVDTPKSVEAKNVTRTQVSNVYMVTMNDNVSEGLVTFTFDPEKVNDLDKLGIWMYDEESTSWKYLGGVVDKEANQVTLLISSSAKIALMETNVRYSDVQGHWSEEAVEFFASRELLPYPESGEFYPDKGITRAEFTAAMTQFLGLEMSEIAHDFEDIEEGVWYEPYISAAKEAGLVKGTSETEFSPDLIIKRQEMAAIVIRALQGNYDYEVYQNVEELYIDDENIQQWAVGYVYRAKELNLMVGDKENYYLPLHETTKGEVAQLIYNIFLNLE